MTQRPKESAGGDHSSLDAGRAIVGPSRGLDVSGYVQKHPYGALAAAAAAGYVIAGGLLTPLTARLAKVAVKAGLRFAVLPLIERELVTAAERLVRDGDLPTAP